MAWAPGQTQTPRPFSTAPGHGLCSSLLPGCHGHTPMFYSGSSPQYLHILWVHLAFVDMDFVSWPVSVSYSPVCVLSLWPEISTCHWLAT